MRYLLTLFSLSVFILVACHKESPPKLINTSFDEPLVYPASINDSLPIKLIEKFHLQGTQGVAIDYQPNGKTYYFSYTANHQELLREVNLIPFSKYADIASTLCQSTTHQQLKELQQSISVTEFENSRSFWSADSNSQVFECHKGSFRHTLILLEANKVLHRIEQVS